MFAHTPTLRLLSKKVNYMFIYLGTSICPRAFSSFLSFLQLSLEIPTILSGLTVSIRLVYLFIYWLLI